MHAIKPPDESAASLDEQFGAALAAYIARPDEAHLGRAYELGRDALTQGCSIPRIVATHGRALQAILNEPGCSESIGPLVARGAAFLGESLSSYEMAHRGYREAVIGLRHLNETLEQEI
ncbi:MAG: phosphatase RsbU N-terminal domain-containing protein, partial [Acidimicrobiales bacterium]